MRWRFARAFEDMGGGGSAPMQMEYDADAGAEDAEESPAAGIDPEQMAQAMQQMEDVLSQLRKTNPEAAKQMEAQMQAMGGMNQSMEKAVEEASEHGLRFEVHFPADVVESNATESTARTAVWEYSLDQLQQAPEVLEAYIKP